MAEDNTLYISFTSQDSYNKIKANISNHNENDINRYMHTLFMVHTAGLPSNEAASLKMYVGNQAITDIVTLNQFNNIRIAEDPTTGNLTVYDKKTDEVDTLIGNKDKFYIYCKYQGLTATTYFNIYSYSESGQVYIPITKNGGTTGKLNYMNSYSDITSPELWQKKTFVYYPQSE